MVSKDLRDMDGICVHLQVGGDKKTCRPISLGKHRETIG
jgi:hypothetical protein